MKILIIECFFLIMCLSSLAQSWSPVYTSSGFNQELSVLFADTISDKLYAGGAFNLIDSIPINSIAVWNGMRWDSMAGGLLGGGPVFSIINFQNTIYTGGYFIFSKNNGNLTRVNGIAKWNGNSWDSIDEGFHPSGGPRQIIEHNGNLFIAGNFDSAGTYFSSSTVTFDGNSWTPIGIPNALGNGNSGAAECCTFYNNEYFLGGNFNDSAYTIYDFAKFDGTHWINQCTPNGCGFLKSFAVYNNELYMSGIFLIGPAQHIFKFDGTNFSSVGGDVNGEVKKLKLINNVLFAVGGFDSAGVVAANKIAIWDGNSWQPFSNDIFQGDIFDFEVFHDELYVIGNFVSINNIPCKYIAKYNSPLGLKNYLSSKVFDIYPNPTKGKCTIKYQLTNQYKKSLIISDIEGRKLKEYDLSNSTGNYSFDIAEFENGIYLISLINDNIIKTTKIIKNE